MTQPDLVNSLPDFTGHGYLQVLQTLHEVLQPRNYLEVGTCTGESLALAGCASLAVDPSFSFEDIRLVRRIVAKPRLLLFRMESDLFFQHHNPSALLGEEVQLAFLDGMHHCEFLLRDFINTERHCARNSVIVLHDCLPVEEPMADRDSLSRPSVEPHRRWWWAGDVWRTARLLRRARPDLSFTTLDAPPTGLVLITNLDPASTALSDRYDEHVRTMLAWSLAEIGLAQHVADMQVERTRDYVAPEQLAKRFRF